MRMLLGARSKPISRLPIPEKNWVKKLMRRRSLGYRIK